MNWLAAFFVCCLLGLVVGTLLSYIAAQPNIFDKTLRPQYFLIRNILRQIMRPSAQKSIPQYAPITTILELTDHGSTSPVVAPAGQAVFDLQALEYHEGLARIEVWTRNGQGATPTSPGAAATITLHYAFTSTAINDEDDLPDVTSPFVNAHSILANIDDTLVITLPDDSASDDEGTRFHATDPFVVPGRYLYVWYVRDAFAANALIDLKAKLIRC